MPGGAFWSDARGVSADGSVVVGWSEADGRYEAFRWTEADGMLSLGNLGGSTFANDVDADGSVVVGTSNDNPLQEAFIWTAADGMRRLRDVLIQAGAPGLESWTLVSATGISADGRTICGFGQNPAGATEAWIRMLPPRCYPDFSGDGTLDFFNFLAFFNSFNNGEDRADCNDDGVLDLFDFLCFVNAFNAGC